MTITTQQVTALSLALLFISGCSEDPVTEEVLIDFENEAELASVTVNHGTVTAHEHEGGTAVRVDMASASNHITAFEIAAEPPWDLSTKGAVALALDIQNPGPTSASLYVTTTDSTGQTQIRTTVVPAESNGTYFVELSSPALEIDSGLRSDPLSWTTDYTMAIWRGGTRKLELSGIRSLRFDVRGVLEDKSFIIDNVRLIFPSDYDENYLAGLVDEYGQSAKNDFANRIASTEELVAAGEQELAQLASEPPPGRSRFGGWADGPRLEATGYFRTEQHDGKWWLVDPEGHLFFSNGIANVRMSNTQTMTGYDFDAAAIEQRSGADLTPEDSEGLNRAPNHAWPTRYVSSELRANMFTWLPQLEHPLAQHYGYRRDSHSGPLKTGETFSFYRANLARKFESDDPQEFMPKWRDVTVDRMLSWGFTSFGNWIDPMFYQLDRFPYFANGWIIGDFKTVSSGNDYWAPLPDPFDPLFEERAYATVRQIAAEVQDNPWCIGVFIDNEKSWGVMGSVGTQYGVVINTLARTDDDSPTKARFTRWLKSRHGDIDALNAGWQADFESWEELSAGVAITDFTDAMTDDFSALLALFAEEYFRIVARAVDQLMPNHMYLGARFADWGMTPELRSAAARHVDVMSYNFYREGISDVFWSFLADIDMPSIIGEFHNGSLDSGLLNPGLIHAESQTDRGRKYAEYVNSVLGNDWFVGVHWFQYIDSPLTGRALDGENYNVGFVSVTDQPYEPLVEAAKEVNANLYERRFGR